MGTHNNGYKENILNCKTSQTLIRETAAAIQFGKYFGIPPVHSIIKHSTGFSCLFYLQRASKPISNSRRNLAVIVWSY